MGVEVKGLDKLRRKVSALPQVLNDAMYDATVEITELVRSAAKLKLSSSMKYSNGELLDSVKEEVVIDSEGKMVGRVWSDKPHAVYRELGTGPVGEASAKDLPDGINPVYTQTRWFIPADEVAIDLNAIYGMPKATVQGKEYYITNGQPARPFLYLALKEILPQMSDIYKENVQKKLEEISNG